jgi:hypothetical protein
MRVALATGPSTTVIHFAIFKPARQRGELIEMKASSQNPDVASRTGKWIAL